MRRARSLAERRATAVPIEQHPCAPRTTHCGDPGCDQCSERFMPAWSACVAAAPAPVAPALAGAA